jgi:cyclase
LVGLVTPALAEDAPRVTSTLIKDNLYLLQGRGGNVLASRGEDGVLLIDDDYAQYAELYRDAVKSLGADSARFVINTHFHGDHTGSNGYWGEAGAVILAQDNVRARMSTRQDNKVLGRVTEASPAAALPMVSFADSLALHFNGDTLELQHYPTGHTDGDTVVFFVSTNVVHMGDHYFANRFPFIDLGSGGNVAQFIVNVEAVLARVDAQTIIVPGHGDLSNREELSAYLAMLKTTRSAVVKMRADGLSDDDILARGLGSQWESWGSGFINEERWIRTLLSSV